MMEFFDSIQEIVNGETTSEEKVICTVNDEGGYPVTISRQKIYRKNGELIDDCLIASHADGTLYPDYASDIVRRKMKEISEENRKETKK